jgi:hypothetical protein
VAKFNPSSRQNVGAAGKSPFDLAAEMAKQELELIRNTRAMELLGRTFSSPIGQAYLNSQTARMAQNEAAAASLRARATSASAAHAWTPEGQAQIREKQAASREEKSAALSQAQAENIAAYGKLGGGAVNAAQGLGRMAAASQP